MTVIELFQKDPLDNIATCLTLKPDKLVLIGDGEDFDSHVTRYRELLNKYRLPTKVDGRRVALTDINGVVAELTDIVKGGDRCIIDLSGGDGVLLAAAGIVYDRYKDRYPISLNPQAERGGAAKPSISVKDLIALYGGGIVSAEAPSSELSQVNPIWQAVSRNSEFWNRSVNTLNEFERWAKTAQKGLEVTMDFYKIQQAVSNYQDKRARFDRLISDLDDCGVVSIRSRDEGHFQYTYTSDFARRCLRKEGNALEYKVLFEAQALRKDGRPFFNDCLLGVTIDWDNHVHPPVYGGVKDSKNEIDVLLMRGLTPVFISCKNGDIGDGELYKLNTVAQLFGGAHAKRLLVATNFRPDNLDSLLSVQQRARDMGICFMHHAAALSAAGWRELFLKLFAES